MEITRRQLIISGAIAAPSLALLTSSPVAARPVSGSPWEAAPGVLREVRFFSSDFTTAYRLAFPGSIEVTADEVAPRVLEMQTDLDSRLVSSSAVVVGDEAEVVLGVEVAREQDAERDIAAFRAPLTNLGVWDSVSVNVPAVVLPLYPNDGVDLSEGLLVALSASQAGGFSEVWQPEVLGAGGLAWGAAVAAAWATTPNYVWPTTIFLESVGPGEVPASSVLEVVLDKRLVASVQVDRSGLPIDSVFSDLYEEAIEDVGDQWRLTITVLSAIPAGTTVRLGVKVLTTDDAVELPKTATVRFSPSDPSNVWQRHTQRELSRYSSVPTDDLPRTTRGNK